MKFEILFFLNGEVSKRVSTKVGSATSVALNALWETNVGQGFHSIDILPTARLRRVAAMLGATSWTY